MSRPARIAFISEHASPLACLGSADAGGQNIYVDELSRHLGERGYQVDVFTRRDSPDLPTVSDLHPGVRVVHLDAGPPRFCPKDELWPFMPAFRDALLRFLQQEEIRYDLVHGHFWMSGWVATELQRLCGIPGVELFHATGETKRRYQGAADTSPAERIAVEREIVRQITRVMVQCPHERNELLGDYQARPGKLVMIPGAVNLRSFYPVEQAEARQRIGLPQDGYVIVYVGRLLPRKDIRNIVRALAHLVRQESLGEAPLTLLIVGGETEDADPQKTEEIGEIQHLARELGVERYVHCTGKRPTEGLRYYYSAGDVVVTTPWYEPFGLTPLEAMACGRPVIGSAVGGLTYTIVDGQTGILVPPRDPAQLAARLLELLTHPERGMRMGLAGRQRVEQEFSWPLTALRTATLYETLLATQARRSTRFWTPPPFADWQKEPVNQAD
jgi:glycosyltransferase involved in cell wall biosynthesis